MIDEADEFVAGPQNKKRGNSSDSNSSATMKRRRSMSPLLRRPQTPPGSTNHVLAGKSPVGVQGQQNLIKPIAQHKGKIKDYTVCDDHRNTDAQTIYEELIESVAQMALNSSFKSFVTLTGVDGNNTVVTESNGDGVLGPESVEIWPTEMDAEAENPPSLNLEEKAGPGAADQGEDINMTEEGLVEDRLDELPPEEKHNCDRLSPQSQLEGLEADPAVLETIFIAPLDGSQAELRSRVIKEVRKPGRSESEPVQCITLHFILT